MCVCRDVIPSRKFMDVVNGVHLCCFDIGKQHYLLSFHRQLSLMKITGRLRYAGRGNGETDREIEMGE